MQNRRQYTNKQFLTATAGSMLIVFVVLPLGLPMFGISPLNSIAVAVLTAGTFADAFTTRYGFRFGGSELNPIFKLTRNHLGQDGFLAFMATTKVSLGLALLIFLPYPYLLFLLALISLSGVLFNSIGLAFSAH